MRPEPFLLDTHALLWAAKDDPQLSATARSSICSGAPIYVSVASVCETAIKVSNGRLTIKLPVEEWVARHVTGDKMKLIPIHVLDCRVVATFSREQHRDPFDRMLAAQAMSRRMTLVTCDSAFAGYNVKTPW